MKKMLFVLFFSTGLSFSQTFDNVTSYLESTYPEDPRGFSKMSNEQLQDIVNKQYKSEIYYEYVAWRTKTNTANENKLFFSFLPKKDQRAIANGKTTYEEIKKRNEIRNTRYSRVISVTTSGNSSITTYRIGNGSYKTVYRVGPNVVSESRTSFY